MDQRAEPQTWLAEGDDSDTSRQPENGSPGGAVPADDGIMPATDGAVTSDRAASSVQAASAIEESDDAAAEPDLGRPVPDPWGQTLEADPGPAGFASPDPGFSGAGSGYADPSRGYAPDPGYVGPGFGPAAPGIADPGFGPPTAGGSDPGFADPSFAPLGQPGPTATMQMQKPYGVSARESQGPMARITASFSSLTRNRRLRVPRPTPTPSFRRYPEPARPAAEAPAAARATVTTRRAQLVLSRIEPWSVMKFSFMVSLVGWVVLFVAVAALYYLLSKLGVFHSIEQTIGQVTSSKGKPGSNASSWFSASRVLGYTMLAGAVNVVLITAMATLGAVIYNLVTHLAGGIEVTLKETD